MKLKPHAMLLVVIGLILFVFGTRAVFMQYAFVQHAEIAQGTIVSVSVSGRRSTTTRVVVSYVLNEIKKTKPMQTTLFANPLEFSEGREVTLRVSPDGTKDPEIYRGLQDAVMYYAKGVFLMLLGAFFAMMGLLIQKFGKD